MRQIYKKFMDKIQLNNQKNKLSKCHRMMTRVAATQPRFTVTM
jgi:hypothetical protein